MMQMATETVGTAPIRVWNGGSGKPLLYLHGFEQHPGNAPFLRRMARGRAVRAPEHPGFGESEGMEPIHDIVDLVLHYRRQIEAWGVGPVDLVGHSLGGMFAAELAALCPHLVRRLVLVDPYGLWLDDTPLPDPFVLPQDRLDAAKWFDPDAAGREPSAFAEGAMWTAPNFRARNLGAATKFMWPIPDRGLSRRLPHVKAPTLILHGAADGLVPWCYAEAFAALLPDARAVRIEGAGHLPMVEAEDAFMAELDAFLD